MAFQALSDLFGSKQPKVKTTPEYQKWRETVFAVPPEEVGIAKHEARRVYGVITDIGQMDRQSSTSWVLSFSAFSTGEASFRPSVGGGVVGLGGDPKIAQEAQEIVQIAQGLLPQTKPTQDLSLPDPGFVQIFFLTTSGLYGVKDQLVQFQKPESPFQQLLARFRFIHQFADQILDGKQNFKIKALYVVALTPEELQQDKLIPLVFFASDRLKAANSAFKGRMERMESKTPIEISNSKYVPNMHTPESMQTSMQAFLKKYNVTFHPAQDDTFFVHGMKDPQGKEHVFLFYFNME